MNKTVSKVLTKIFGSKSERDIKQLTPRVTEINQAFEGLSALSHDELRQKTQEFRNRIAERLRHIDQELESLDQRLDTQPEMEPEEQDEIYQRKDELNKQRDQELETILEDLLPEAFAVVKETARRFTENADLPVQATERDKEMAQRRRFVDVEGEQAVYHNRWEAAGNDLHWSMVHYDVQLMGGVVLHEGKIAEMATGEGKTLVSTLPAYLNALSGQGVHIVTPNDYLARRDAEWNGALFEFLGITVDCIEYYQPHSPERRRAYQADITYGTNNEFGFDYLRDNMVRDPAEMVQRKHHYAIVDEVDSVLIDDARTPLIISGPVPNAGQDQQRYVELKPLVEKLINAQKEYVGKCLIEARKRYHQMEEDRKVEEQAGLALLRAYRGLPKNKQLIKFLSEEGVRAFLQKTENYYLQDMGKEMPKVDQELYFVIDEKNNNVELTDKGIELLTRHGAEDDANFFVIPDVGARIAEIERSEALSDKDKLQQKDELMRHFAAVSERVHVISQLLKSYALFEKDQEYIIQDDKVKIVDEQTGRVMEGRRYSDGLHQAIEAKENVRVQESSQTWASVTLQNYFRMYHKLAGMTGTAETEAAEFEKIYSLEVTVVPTHKPVIRDDRQDLVYKTAREKYNAVIEEIQQLVDAGRPVLVGTTSVEVSELLSRMLKLRKIRHNVLNAKQHQREAEIIAEAGQRGAVTIATNMAGRGTDIKLGEGVVEAGGLAIIGTERHESRRVDRQLRGRAGRQGDPGSSQFFVSLEDNLMRLFGSERISKWMDRMGLEEGEVIQHSMITNSIERAQRKVEENNFGIRKNLLEYDDVMNNQREVIYARRRNALFGHRLSVDIAHAIEDIATELVSQYKAEGNFEGFNMEVLRLFAMEAPFNAERFRDDKESELAQELYAAADKHYRQRMDNMAEMAWPVIEDVYQTRGDQITNVVVPFTDGIKAWQVTTNLEKLYGSKARSLPRALERSVALTLIDDAWKEHLREMDDLRQAVRTASYEQKDPLLVYKFESFKLFQDMLARLNKDMLSMLYHGHIQTEEPDEVQEAKRQKTTPSRGLKTSRKSQVPSSPTETAQPVSASEGGEEQGDQPPKSRRQRRMEERAAKKRKAR
jgi:preprotein translocase subunit SecA